MGTKDRVRLSASSVLFAAIMLLTFATTGLAQDSRYWVGSGVGNWSDTSNWSATSGGAGGASAPGFFDANIRPTDSLDREVIYDIAGPNQIQTLRLRAEDAGDVLLTITGGELAGSSNWYTGGWGIGSSDIVQLDGSVNLAKDLWISAESYSHATYRIENGTLHADEQLNIGHAGTSVFTQNGGLVSANEQVHIGESSISDGTYIMTAGRLETYRLGIGLAGGGHFVQASGVVVADNVLMANDAHATTIGTYHLSGDARLEVANDAYIGWRHTADMTQDSGVVQIGGAMKLGGDNGGTATVASYTLNDGTLTTATSAVGNAGDALFTQNGGTHTVAGDLIVTRGSDLLHQPSATYDLFDGTVTANRVVLGDGRGSGGHATGTFNVYGGEINIATDITFGLSDEHSIGTLNIAGGIVRAPALLLDIGDFDLSLVGGTLQTDDIEFSVTNDGSTLASYTPMGTIDIDGHYVQNSGTLRIEIGGETAGVDLTQLRAAGAISLNGDVSVAFDEWYRPDIGDFFDIAIAENFAMLNEDLTLAFEAEGFAGVLSVHDITIGPDAGSDVVRLQITAVGPAVVPAPGALWAGLALGASIITARTARRRNGKRV